MGETPKQKSRKQESECAKRFGGRTTLASGALFFDKGDCVFKAIRLENKRTDKDGIYIEGGWIRKVKRELRPDEFYAMEIEIKEDRIYLISENEFRFVEWILNTPAKEIIEALNKGSC